MEFKNWLIEKMSESGLNSASLAEAISENQPTVYRIISGETKNPRLSIVKKLEKFFNSEFSSIEKTNTNQKELLISQYHDVRGAMGNGLVLRGESGQITGWKVTPEWISKNVPSNTGSKNLAIVTGFGDSMRGMFNSGDPLLVDTGIKSLDYDGVYFFRVGDEGFIKTLQRIPGDGIRVISENKKYETWTINADMDFEVFGRVLKVWKSEEF
jgi:phage repressor protein C with HTH and peptisase S24 domain